MDDTTALLDAAEKGDLAVVRNALANGVDIDARNSFEETALFLASKGGHLDVVLFLLEQKADVHALNSGNQNALHAACISGSLPIVEKLLAVGVNPGQATASRKKPLWFAVNYAHLDIIKYFVEHDLLESRGIKDLPFFTKHAKAKAKQIFAIIFFKYASLTEADQDALISNLVATNVLDGLKYLLENFPTIKTKLARYFHALLLGFETKEDCDMFRPSKTKSETLQHYLANTWGYQASNPALKFLLKQGLVMDAQNMEGQTLLHCAAVHQFDEYEHLTHLKYLLDIGYPVDLTNACGQTALQFATQQGWVFHAMYLIYRGADVKHVDKYDRTALDYAKSFCLVESEPSDPYGLECQAALIQVLKDYGAVD